MEDLY